MSVTGHSMPSGFNKISRQWRNYSGELDVFEATKYFSGANETPAHNSPNPIKNVRRMSLDLPKSNVNIPPHKENLLPEKQTKVNKKHKQPSSPSARIARFLNSLFNQKYVKKKKLIKSPGGAEVENAVDQRRRRRSSVSHFPVTNSAVDSKCIYSTSSSGFTTPHVHANTPTKSYKELRSFSDPLHHVSKSSENCDPGLLKHDEYNVKKSTDHAWSDEKLGFRSNGSTSAKVVRSSAAINYWVEKYSLEAGRKFSHGGESDSSSDLFDLPNYDLDFCSSSSGLPVYETTQMDRIKNKSVLISSSTATA